jgi:hypothetical protein
MTGRLSALRRVIRGGFSLRYLLPVLVALGALAVADAIEDALLSISGG